MLIYDQRCLIEVDLCFKQVVFFYQGDISQHIGRHFIPKCRVQGVRGSPRT